MTIPKLINCILEIGKIQNFILNINTDKNGLNSGIINLRKFHNLIKNELIIHNAINTKSKSLLDIACGRGGDIHKWIQAKLNYIFAFDNHSESIYNEITKGSSFDGAIGRFKQIKATYKGKMPYMKFQHIDILSKDALLKINKSDSSKIYDIVSCQFAFHYFCKDISSMEHVLSIISNKLKKGGLFIGTATDGDLIYNILEQGDVNIPLLTLLKNSKEETNYYFYITETNNTLSNSNIRKNYFEIQGVSSEFYLFKQKFKEIAIKYNLELIEYKSFYDWYLLLTDKIKPGQTGYKELQQMSIYEFIISFLNFSFIFKKI